MRLLILCERVGTTGGMERYLQTTLPLLLARGHTVHVVAREIDEPDAFGVPCTRLPWSDEHDAPDETAGAHLAGEIAHFAPDAVITHNVLDASVLEVAAGAPRRIDHLHDHRPFCPNGDRVYPRGGANCDVAMGAPCLWHALAHGCAYGPRPKTQTLLRRRQRLAALVRGADGIVVLSRFMADLARKNGCAPERLHVIAAPLGDEAFADPISARPAEDVVLFAGRVMPSKGLLSLVRAVARIDAPARPAIAVAGEGPDLPAANELAAATGCALRPLGHLHPAALRAAMDAASIVAVPSHWAEPFGLVGIEAHARGRPVVAYDTGAIGEWMNGGGTLVAPDDIPALAEAMERYLRDSAVWTAASRSGYADARARYGSSEHVSQLERLYAGSPAGHRGRALT